MMKRKVTGNQSVLYMNHRMTFQFSLVIISYNALTNLYFMYVIKFCSVIKLKIILNIKIYYSLD